MKARQPVVFHSRESARNGLSFHLADEHHFIDKNGGWAGWAARIVNERGHVSRWHHHPASDTYVYILRGTLTISFGAKGAESIQAHPGDLVLIPSEVVHRETTGEESNLEAFVFRVGSPPESVEVDSP